MKMDNTCGNICCWKEAELKLGMCTKAQNLTLENTLQGLPWEGILELVLVNYN